MQHAQPLPAIWPAKFHCALSNARHKIDIPAARDNLIAARKRRSLAFCWRDGRDQDFGLTAQPVGGLLPMLVGDEVKDLLKVNDSQLSIAAIGAMQEQQAQRESDRVSSNELAGDNADFKTRIATLEAALLAITKTDKMRLSLV